MKRLSSLIILSILAGFCAVAFGDDADKVNVDQSGTKGQSDENITYLAVAADLAAVAQSTKDPILMLAAARLEAMAATHEAPKDKTAEGEDKAETEDKSEKANLYALAEEYAGSNNELLALIQDFKGDVSLRGLRGGAADHQDRVRARSTDIYNLTFKGRKFAEIAVLGDRDTDLDLYVYDENGHEICSDTDLTDQTYCSWTPRWTGRFRIEIRNLGNVSNYYTLLTN